MSIVGIGWNGTKEEVDGFVARHGLTFANVHDVDGSIFASFGVPGQPAWVFQNANGNRDVVVGAASEAEVDARLANLAG